MIDTYLKYFDSIDFACLDASCNTKDNGYAKEVLKAMHDIFTDTYGTDFHIGDYEYMSIPAVIRGRESKHTGLALIAFNQAVYITNLDNIYLTPLGVAYHGAGYMTDEKLEYLNEKVGTYDVWFPVDVSDDLELRKAKPTKTVSELIEYCQPVQPGMTMG